MTEVDGLYQKIRVNIGWLDGFECLLRAAHKDNPDLIDEKTLSLFGKVVTGILNDALRLCELCSPWDEECVAIDQNEYRELCDHLEGAVQILSGVGE